ncbi:SDR family NAD(P)-dependent oxidoreductase [Streptomyces sp. NPDC091271]|uniref:SDR family NAD(P)-dependent oxidoreductase n=1 Tax=Streptomyces sp. NPDC091271 TaxID=3365980 RepID=UPI0037F72742
MRADLGTCDGVEELWKQVQEIGRPLDITVLDAGRSIGGAFATDTDLDDELKLIALNINAVVLLAKRVVPGMLARGQGRILITSSISATPLPGATDSDFHPRAGMGDTSIGKEQKKPVPARTSQSPPSGSQRQALTAAPARGWFRDFAAVRHLDSERSRVAGTAESNRSKSYKDPAVWLPRLRPRSARTPRTGSLPSSAGSSPSTRRNRPCWRSRPATARTPVVAYEVAPVAVSPG